MSGNSPAVTIPRQCDGLQFNRNFPWVREVFAPPYPEKCRPDMKLLYELCNETAQELNTTMEFIESKGIPQPPAEEFDDPSAARYSEYPLDYILDKVLKRMIRGEVIKRIVKDIMKNRRTNRRTDLED